MSKSSESTEATMLEQSVYDMFSLESMGCHLFWSEVDADSSRAACEFIIKSNLLRQHDPITMLINSVGGECGEGFAVIDLMDTSRIPISTVGTGSIMSMGLLLVSAGTHGLRSLTKNTEIMAHQFSGYFSGKQHELIATQTAYTLLEAKFVKHFERHSTMSEKQIRDVLFSPSDRYLTPQECKSFGLVDRIVDYFDQPIDGRLIKRVREGRSASAQLKRPIAAKPRSRA